MGRPRTITDERILNAACDVFLEHGPGASTAIIAEQLGISQAALFKRFSTKEELLIAALRPPLPLWVERLGAGPDERPILEQLLELSVEVNDFHERVMPRMMMLKASGIGHERIFQSHDGPPPPIQSHQSLVGWLRQAQEVGRIRPGDPEVMATAFMGSITATVFYKHVGGLTVGGPDPQGFLRELTETLWRALAPDP